MSVDVLVIDRRAVGLLNSALFEDSWFQDFNIPPNIEKLRRVQTGNITYILSNDADLSSGLLVVRTGSAGIFAHLTRPRTAFERILRVALRHFDRNITLPTQWQPYHEGSLLSVYAEPFQRTGQHRLYFDQSPANNGANIYAFGVTQGPANLADVQCDHDAYKDAISGVLEALTTTQSDSAPVGNFGILLTSPIGVQLAGPETLEVWLKHKLNDEQLRFVNQTPDRPIRLRGVAGTGKTRAMAVKCLKELYEDDDKGGDKNFAFLTHSTALAHNVVRGMLDALDPSERWARLKSPNGRSRLSIGTLYELAQEQMNYERKGLRPLSLDGTDGRELQRLLIEDAIEEMRKDPRIALGPLGQCPDLAKRMTSAQLRSGLIEDLMNEFACILDAGNIRKGTADADRYIMRSARENWQMNLPTESDRKIVLEIYECYRDKLRKERLLSMDQMMADFARYLSTHEWDQLRDQNGFDVIFVDEYHYFTRVEAMALQGLFCPRANHSGRWPLIMAYDLKQSTSDASLGGGIERFRNSGVGESKPVDLTHVYRSTPQISAFLRDLDASFPAIDLEGEFATYTARSKAIDGEIPKLLEFPNNVALIDEILERANKYGRDLPGGGSQVAVLCLNDDLFEQYRKASRVQSKSVAVTSREDLSELRYARSRCVFSMPEYVAGLQFEAVYLVHVDQGDLADEYLSLGARRRYVSRAYLGASRAQRHLTLAYSKERGGRSELLEAPIRNGSLIAER